jgi:polyribonucleotide nucleotidyltransferase
MAQYLSPYPGHKKTVIFKQREKELLHAIKNGFNNQKLHKAAEKLRAAKMHLIKAMRQSIETYREEDKVPVKRLEKLKVEAEEWESASAEDIINKYKPKQT